MSKTITKIPIKPNLAQKKKVAAYARVSSGKDAMLHSLSAQISYYSKLIQGHNDWKYMGVYADEAISGTKTERDAFQRLLADCKSGKVDMVITKSISRFARNTVALLETVRELKLLGVDIYFEEQNIHTMSNDGELMLTILASYAQEESLSASENQKWRVKRNFEQGKPWNGTLLGYRIENGKYVVVPEEGEIVKLIFEYYLSGLGVEGIARKLNASKICTRIGGRWGKTSVSKVLRNYSYIGNLLLQKTYSENHITKRKLMNNGELPKYHVEESHEPIISPQCFEAVQQEIAKRAAKSKTKNQPRKSYPFSGMLTCNNCGKSYRRKTTKTGVVWICSTYNTLGKAVCSSKQIPETTLIDVSKTIMGVDNFNEELFAETVNNIKVCQNNILFFYLRDGTEIEITWADRSRSQSWTAEMRQEAAERQRRKNQCQEQ